MYTPINSTNGNVNRNVKYVNRDFSELRGSLIEFAKTYFPTTVNDFTPASPATMFIEMAAYVGDVMSFYTDNQIQENFTQYARQANNQYALAYMMGYKPKVSTAASADLDVYQQVPAIQDGSDYVPDYRYALIIDENTVVNSSNANVTTNFITQDKVDFTVSSSADPTTVSVFEMSGNNPATFLLKKTVKAISATITTKTFTIGEGTRFETLEISDSNILGILDVTDSENNDWTEVDYLAQETVYQTVRNTSPFNTDPTGESDAAEVPNLLRLRKAPRRFVSRFLNKTTLQLQFGAGTTDDQDEQLIPNPDNVGLNLGSSQSKLTTAFAPNNFLFTKTYGIAPSNTTLTVRYLTGGGVAANAPALSLDTIDVTTSARFSVTGLDATEADIVFDSVAVSNPSAASGGGSGDDAQDLRQNTLAAFATQQRAVTKDDYVVRALSMPSEYGAIARVHAETPRLDALLPGESAGSVDLYVTAFDANGNFTPASRTLKTNLRTYLSQNRIIGDFVRIRDAFVVNLGVDFEIVVLPNFNNQQVLSDCITELKAYFANSNANINQPIFLNELYLLLNQVNGVQTVKDIQISNKAGVSEGYSQYAYDVNGATVNGVLYPSQDPCIFEVKNPNNDIKGRVVPL